MQVIRTCTCFFSRFLESRNYKIQVVARVGRKSAVLLSGIMEASYSHFFIGRKNEEKEAILRQIYYDTEHGFGSIYETYKQAVKLLPSVTLNDVREFLAKQESRQLKAYRGFSSYVAHEPLQEIQIDLADFTKSARARRWV